MFEIGDKVQLVGYPTTDPKYQSIGRITAIATDHGKTKYFVTVKQYLPMAIDQENLLLIK